MLGDQEQKNPDSDSFIQSKSYDVETTRVDFEDDNFDKAFRQIGLSNASDEKDSCAVQYVKPFIGSRYESADYCVYNPHIYKGYRINYKSWGVTIWSLFQCHNETINVWTHFLGFWACMTALIIIGANYNVLPSQITDSIFDINGIDQGFLYSQEAEFRVFVSAIRGYISTSEEESDEAMHERVNSLQKAEVVTKWPLMAYILTALFCLGSSAACHLCYVRSERVSSILTSVDYWGICILFLGSCYPYISFKYACGPFVAWRYIFTTMIFILTLLCMWATVQKTFFTPGRRVALFMLFALSCFVPSLMLYVWDDPKNALSPNPGPYLWPILCYTIGIFFYISRIPECFSKIGVFDYLGASHQIFHCTVLVAIYFNFQANQKLYEERLLFVCPAQVDTLPPSNP